MGGTVSGGLLGARGGFPSTREEAAGSLLVRALADENGTRRTKGRIPKSDKHGWSTVFLLVCPQHTPFLSLCQGEVA